MAFEKARGAHTRLLKPIVDRMSNVDPSTLTWISVLFAAGCCYLIATAGRDTDGGWRLIGAFALLLIAAELDALDGAVARAYDKVSKYGDWLDHTIDRLVDIALLVAIGLNSEWTVHWLGWAAATLTLLGSYMGTQAQSVGLGRNYGGFGRADRLVVTFVGLIWGAIMAFNGTEDYATVTLDTSLFDYDIGINALSAVLIISLVGGIWTFLKRAAAARRELLSGE
ncbi:MAG: CDP-alcohol phosphatidyltransferase family protein [Candidatus Thermoplasmatota archaeon]|nr:CDP-alcohol phosphatidyltransferase family protein [Candidatus Thermoplasmatota archaeon]